LLQPENGYPQLRSVDGDAMIDDPVDVLGIDQQTQQSATTHQWCISLTGPFSLAGVRTRLHRPREHTEYARLKRREP
jgi:hypothetical protein